MRSLIKYFVKLSAMYLSLWGALCALAALSAFTGTSQAGFFVTAAALFVTSFGIFRFKAWARTAVFILCGLALVFGIKEIIRFLLRFNSIPAESTMPPEALWVSAGTHAALLIVIPALFILLFSRRSAAALFEKGNI